MRIIAGFKTVVLNYTLIFVAAYATLRVRMYLEVVLPIPFRRESTSKVIRSLLEDYTLILHSFISTDSLLSIVRRKSLKFCQVAATVYHLPLLKEMAD